MFESAELGHKVDKARYAEEEPKLREALLAAQYDLLKSKRFPLVILIGGVDGAGKGETVNQLNEWMDPRHVASHAFPDPTEEERERPPLYRFMRSLPPRGKTGIFFGSWYTAPIVNRVTRGTSAAEFDRAMEEIIRFERMLANEGALLLKFWFHLSKEAQKKRLESLEKKARTRWRVTPQDWKNFEKYDRFRKWSERALRLTSREEAPWVVVEGTDERYRSLTVGQSILSAVRARLDAPVTPASTDPSAPIHKAADEQNVLRALDLTKRIPDAEYKRELEEQQGRLNLLSRSPAFKNVSVVAVFEGQDAAGKGGAIRRVTQSIDARQYRVVPIAAPTEEERAQPYLWRFYRHLDRRGRFAIFDRSWYGRVLVERVEGFCSESDYLRAYGEINDFEEHLHRHGIVVLKFWLQVDPDEQLRRFKERESISFKRFKITEEDWRNRDKWDRYESAVVDMVDRTSTEIAPWTLVEANDKNYARIKILRTMCDRIEHALKK
jgi:polyphosphate:AMP phosphotransferase